MGQSLQHQAQILLKKVSIFSAARGVLQSLLGLSSLGLGGMELTGSRADFRADFQILDFRAVHYQMSPV